MFYIVQEFVAGRWYTARTYRNRDEAEAYCKTLGHKCRIVEKTAG